MRTVLAAYYRLLCILLTVLMGLLIVPVTMQIISRYTGLIPRYIWTEEAARFCFMWIIMIGSMIAVRDATHFAVDVLPAAKTPRGDAVGRIVVHVCMLALALIFIWYGWAFAQFGAAQRSELTGINMLVIYIAWPLAGVTWLLFLAEKFVDDIAILRGRDNGAR